MFWTEGGIRAVISSELAGKQGKEIICEHVKALLREEIAPQLGDELRAVSERLGEGAKAALHRKLNAIYAAHIDRLRQRLDQFEHELEETSPRYRQKLEEFEKGIKHITESYQKLLSEPKDEILRDFRKQANITTRQIEKRLRDILETKLQDLILDTVREHVSSMPFEQEAISNKQLAAAKGISLRAAKRLRRAS